MPLGMLIILAVVCVAVISIFKIDDTGKKILYGLLALAFILWILTVSGALWPNTRFWWY
jgi:hypothetical protein